MPHPETSETPEDLLDPQVLASPQTCGTGTWARCSATHALAGFPGSACGTIGEQQSGRVQAIQVKAEMQCSDLFYVSEPPRSLLVSSEYGYSPPIYYTNYVLDPGPQNAMLKIFRRWAYGQSLEMCPERVGWTLSSLLLLTLPPSLSPSPLYLT